jgi:hypothetical protein
MMWRLPLIAALLVAGCGAKIGDACKTNIDCSPLGDRFCDTAPPNGYCTQEDCGLTSCPSEAACIRFFTALADEPCTFDPNVPFSQATCASPDERCVCDVSDNGTCTNNAGHCAPSATERHWCMRKCSNDGDCREGYECRQTGTFGAEPIPTFSSPQGDPTKFCAPKPTPF